MATMHLSVIAMLVSLPVLLALHHHTASPVRTVFTYRLVPVLVLALQLGESSSMMFVQLVLKVVPDAAMLSQLRNLVVQLVHLLTCTTMTLVSQIALHL